MFTADEKKKNSNNKEVRDCLLVFAYDTRYLKIGYLFILLLIQYLIFMCKISVLLYPWHVPTASVLYLGKIGVLYDSSMMASLSLFHVLVFSMPMDLFIHLLVFFALPRLCLYILIKIWDALWQVNHLRNCTAHTRQVSVHGNE